MQQPINLTVALLTALPGAARGRCLPASAHGRCLPTVSRSHRWAAAYQHRRDASSSELHMPTSLHSPSSREMFALKLHVASICFKCLKCFRDMLQVVYKKVVKVDPDVAHVAIVAHVCCKLLLSMFHLFLFDVCCKCVYLDVAYVFTHMMQVFYLDVAYVYNVFKCFCFCKWFRRMFQMFHLFLDVCCNCCIGMF
jgi:hypothetical protein